MRTAEIERLIFIDVSPFSKYVFSDLFTGDATREVSISIAGGKRVILRGHLLGIIYALRIA